MASMLKVMLLLGGSYAAVLVTLTCLAGIHTAATPEDCDDNAGNCKFGGALMLLLTTFHGTTWGHVLPVTNVQQAISCIVAAMGYLWPLGMAVAILAFAGQEKLAKRGALAFSLLYLLLTFLGNLIMSIVMVASGGHMADEGIGRVFYFSWLTFHSRSYGALYPDSALEDVCTIMVQLAGTAAWLVPLLIVARSAALNTARRLQNPVPGKTLFPDSFAATCLPYLLNGIAILILSGIYTSLEHDECDEDYNQHHEIHACGYGNAFFLLLTTFHGNAFGHKLPRTHGQATVSCIVASLGFLWRHVVAILVLHVVQQPVLAKIAAAALSLTYTLLAVICNLAFAGIIVASDGHLCRESQRLSSEWDNTAEATGELDGCSFGAIFYYLWMSFHSRAYGELVANTSLEDLVSVLVVVASASCWVVPVLAVLRRASIIGILQEVSSNAPPTVLGVCQKST